MSNRDSLGDLGIIRFVGVEGLVEALVGQPCLPYPVPSARLPPSLTMSKSPASRPPQRPSPLVIGISGGIASGKSSAARALAGRDGRVISADDLAHEVLASPEVTAQVAAHFGPEAIGPDGKPDRKALAAQVFRDPKQRERLEGWIHPAVRARISALLESARAESVPVVVLDVPLLFENDPAHDLIASCDVLVFVDAPAPSRDARAARDRGWAPGEVARREAAQMPLAKKRDASHFRIQNDGDLEALQREAQRVLDALRTPPATPHER